MYRKPYPKISANKGSGLKMIVEINLVPRLPLTPTEQPTLQNVGWTVLDIFNEEAELCAGAWRVPIYIPNVDPAATPHIVENSNQRK